MDNKQIGQMIDFKEKNIGRSLDYVLKADTSFILITWPMQIQYAVSLIYLHEFLSTLYIS